MPMKAQIDQMNSAINTYNQKKTDIMLSYLKMNETVSMLIGDSWTGEASQKFNEEFEAMYVNLRESSDEVDKVIKTLQKVIQKYEETESGISGDANALSEGTVPTYIG